MAFLPREDSLLSHTLISQIIQISTDISPVTFY